MKTRKILYAALLTVFLSGCVVHSFYPLYTPEDLFPNDILVGDWSEDEDEQMMDYEEAVWSFTHPKNKKTGEVDSTTYNLLIREKGSVVSKFSVHVIELGGHYFLDFYLEEYNPNDDIDLADFHIIPVHTFAKLTIKEGVLQINWFDPGWLSKLIQENKIRIHHEKNDDLYLLTAKPHELQKFVTKYVDSEEAFKDGLKVILHRQ